MEIDAMQTPTGNSHDSVERTREIAEQERLRRIEQEQREQVEMRARSPEQSAGQFVDHVV